MCDAEYSFFIMDKRTSRIEHSRFSELSLGHLEKTRCVCYDRDTKKENHRRAATPSQDNGITAYRVKVGRLFLFYGNNVASDENND